MNIENDNRNCNCNMSNNSNVDVISSNYNNSSCNSLSRREMINQIKSYSFAVNDLAIYLDTHPDDTKALCLFRKYANELNDLKNDYQKVYGPLSYYFPCNKWRWLEEPWPWERGNF